MMRLLTIFCLTLLWASATAADPYEATRQSLAAEDIHVTSGAAAGYVPDATCEYCHEGIAASYADVGMSKSFHKPRQSKIIEMLDAAPFVHTPTGHHYQMRWQDGSYLFSRWRLGPDGSPIDQFDAPVDWVIGSGNHSRVYLIQEPNGKLLQLPLAWYTQTQSWGMPPGYEDANHSGIGRSVQRNCMTCHNAFPEVPVNADRHGFPNVFPTDLPEGIGCQRCHGPGADHVKLALIDKAPIKQTIAAIVNPTDLPKERQKDVCYACHLQPAVSIQGQVRHGAGFYSFRPGDTLTDHFLNMDMQDGTRIKSDRFDINHHPYRMEQSACFIESEGELGCLTCHNPHVKVSASNRAAHYKAKCLTCHTTDANDLPEMASGDPHPMIADTDDCTTCHMPRRRTEDVIEVTVTDHLITRNADLGNLVSRRKKHAPRVTSASLYDTLPQMPDAERNVYVYSSILTYDGARQIGATDALVDLLQTNPTSAYEPWLLALKTLIKQKRYAQANQIADDVMQRAPDVPDVIANVALVRYAAGKRSEGKKMLLDLAQSRTDMVTPLFNLASLLAQEKQYKHAATAARVILEREPTNAKAWALLAKLQQATGDSGTAIEAYFAALRIEPRSSNNRKALAQLLESVGRSDEAEQYIP